MFLKTRERFRVISLSFSYFYLFLWPFFCCPFSTMFYNLRPLIYPLTFCLSSILFRFRIRLFFVRLISTFRVSLPGMSHLTILLCHPILWLINFLKFSLSESLGRGWGRLLISAPRIDPSKKGSPLWTVGDLYKNRPCWPFTHTRTVDRPPPVPTVNHRMFRVLLESFVS